MRSPCITYTSRFCVHYTKMDIVLNILDKKWLYRIALNFQGRKLS